MKETFFFENQYAESLKGMERLLQKAETAYRVYKQYPNLPVFNKQVFDSIVKNDSKYLQELIENAANDDLRKMQADRPYMAPGTVLTPEPQELRNQLGSFAAGCHQDWLLNQNNFLRPVVDTCFLDFDKVTGQPTFGERGRNEIKALCSVPLTKENEELINIMTSLSTAWTKAQAYLKNRTLSPNPIRFAIDQKAREALLLIDRQGNLHFNRLLF